MPKKFNFREKFYTVALIVIFFISIAIIRHEPSFGTDPVSIAENWAEIVKCTSNKPHSYYWFGNKCMPNELEKLMPAKPFRAMKFGLLWETDVIWKSFSALGFVPKFCYQSLEIANNYELLNSFGFGEFEMTLISFGDHYSRRDFRFHPCYFTNLELKLLCKNDRRPRACDYDYDTIITEMFNDIGD